MFNQNIFAIIFLTLTAGAALTGVARAQTVGTMSVYNGTSGVVNIGPGDVTITSPFSQTSSPSVTIDSGATAENAVTISGPTKTNVTLTVKAHSQTDPTY